MAAIATFALKPGVWFRRVRLVIVSPDSQRTACLLSGRNSTYRPVQISGTGSHRTADGLRPRGHIELGKFRITVSAAVWVRNVNISGAVAHKLNRLLDGRHGRVPFERQHSC